MNKFGFILRHKWYHTLGWRYDIVPIMVSSYDNKSNTYIVDYLVNTDNRVCNNIPINDFTSTDWIRVENKHRNLDPQKLHILYDIVTYKKIDNNDYCMMCSDDIERLYNKGLLIKKLNKINWYIDFQLEKRGLVLYYRFKKVIPHWTQTYSDDNTTFCEVSENDFFITYHDALERKDKLVEEYENLLKKENSISDYDYSIMEIDKVLSKLNDNNIHKEIKNYIINNVDNIENFEIKIGENNNIYYRYYPLCNSNPKSNWKIFYENNNFKY